MEKTNKILFVIAHELFRDEEYFEPRKILEAAGYKVITASTGLGEALGKLGGRVEVDILFSEIHVTDFDAIVFVGGSGVIALWDNERLHEIAGIFIREGKLTAAICSAPVILAKAGLLKDVRATSFIDDEGHLRHYGATYTGAEVEIDGNIITGNGPTASKKFGEAIVNMLARNID